MKKLFLIITVCFVVFPLTASAVNPFIRHGDGTITLAVGRGGAPQTVQYRTGDDKYIETGLKKINNIFGAEFRLPEWRVSLRLIELLDFLQDHFKGGSIQILDGLRSVQQNEAWRASGKVAASSSTHLDGEAADIIMTGVSPVTIRDYLIPQNCCGVGYYHGKALHVDIGPPRFWDEKTSGTEKKEPPMNEKIIVRTDRDVYKDGEPITLQFSRVNIYPIGVKRTAQVETLKGNEWKSASFSPDLPPTVKDGGAKGCAVVEGRKEGRNIVAKADADGGAETRSRIKIEFCDPKTEKMPPYVVSNEFVVVR